MKEVKKPFFSKFLESQKVEDKTIKGGRSSDATNKHPSDNDEIIISEGTAKYPSDGDDVVVA